MREKAQMCYTDENVGKHMLITTVGINNQRERHMISTIKTIHLTDGVNLLEDGEGTYYISYQIHNKTNKKLLWGGVRQSLFRHNQCILKALKPESWILKQMR